MVRDLNRATIIGVVGWDPETRVGADGRPVTAFPLLAARHRTAGGGPVQQAAEWLTLVAWDDLPHAMSSRLSKNQRIYAEGRVQTRHWEEPGGEQCYRTELVVRRLIPLDHLEPTALGPQQDNDDIPLCLNRVTVVGTLEGDPEMRYTQDGQAITSFGLAATHICAAPDREGQEWTDWFSIQALGSHAELCKQLSKGLSVYVEGEIRTQRWEQAERPTRFPVEIVAREIILLHPRTISDRNVD